MFLSHKISQGKWIALVAENISGSILIVTHISFGQCILYQNIYLLDKLLALAKPWLHLVFPEIDKINIVSLLPTFKKVIINPGKIFRDYAGSNKMKIKKRPYSCMPGR